MKVFVNSIIDTELTDIADYKPVNAFNFAREFSIDCTTEPDGDSGEVYRVKVCTPTWLQEKINNNQVVSGLGLIIVHRFNGADIENYIIDTIENKCQGNTISEVLEKIGTFARSEFHPSMFDV